MYYRHRTLLAFIALTGGTTDKLRLQQLLFLYSTKKQDPEYDFVPYQKGCYSFSAEADLNALVKKGYLQEKGNQYVKYDTTGYLDDLNAADQAALQEIAGIYGAMEYTELLTYIYTHYPFYAIFDPAAKDLLPADAYARVENVVAGDDTVTLYTIGYEGVSLEKYLQKLITHHVNILADVRHNPFSRKWGFSKKQLNYGCENAGITYSHIPEAGIPSSKRRNLKTQEDYDKLFETYRETTLNHITGCQQEILSWLHQYGSVALTCYEADPHRCHRMYLAEAIARLPGFNYAVKHL